MCEIETAAPETPVLPPELFLLKLGEVVLKGLNRSHFEDKLMANVRPPPPAPAAPSASTPARAPSMWSPRAASRIWTPSTGPAARSSASSAWSGPSPARRAWPPSWRPPGSTWPRSLRDRPQDFKVESKRADKTLPLKLHPALPAGGRALLHRAFPKTAGQRPRPGAHGLRGDPGAGRPTSTAPPSPAPGACLWAWAARPSPCSPAASTAPWPPG